VPQALVLQTGGQLGLHHAASAATRTDACPCMGCRTNLKKEKRLRNRINAFRFKKGGFKKPRFPRPDYAADQRKADEDSQYSTLVRPPRPALRCTDSSGSPARLRSNRDPSRPFAIPICASGGRSGGTHVRL
jgi:hypothetical protein